MFLTARLFGVFTYVLLLLVALLGIRYTSKRQTKYVVWGYLLVLCAIAWFYVPYITTDIYRLSEYAQGYAQSSWNDFIYTVLQNKTNMFMFIYFRVFVDCLMPATCFFVFGSVFYIIYNSGQIFNTTRTVLALVFLWFMTNDFYLISISNIRSYVAVAFVSFCIFRETFKHKFGILNIILYFCAIEMHSMGIVLVAFRILAYLFSGGKITIWKIIFIPAILAMLFLAFPWYQDLLSGSAERFERYYQDVDYNYIWERVIFIIQTVVQGYILWKAYYYKLFRYPEFSSYRATITGAFIVLLICHLHVTFMQRWIIFSAILEVPVLIALLQKCYKQKDYSLRNFLVFSSLITFAIVCSRGNLCSLKFWE